MMLNIVIVDDDKGFLDEVYGASTSKTQYTISPVIVTSEIGEDLLAKEAVDFFFVYGKLPSIDGLFSFIKQHWPEAHIVLYFDNSDDSITLKWFNYEINGYLVKQSLLKLFDECIHAILKGHCYLNYEKEKKILFRQFNYKHIQSNLALLSERERQIFELLIQGYSNKLISEKLWISPYTVNQHLKTIYKKLKVTSRIELIRMT